MDEQQKRDEGGDERWAWLLPRQSDLPTTPIPLSRD
jgi:hypothetical protein